MMATPVLSETRIVAVSKWQHFAIIRILYNMGSPARLFESFRAHWRSDVKPRNHSLDEPG